MISRLIVLFQLKTDYHDPLTAQRAHNLLYFLATMTIVFVVVSVLLVLSFFGADSNPDQKNLLMLLVPMFTISFFELVRRYGYYRESAIGVIVLILLILILRITTDNEINNLALVFPIVSAGVLLSWRETSLTLIIVSLLAFSPIIGHLGESGIWSPIITNIIFLGLTTAMVIFFGIPIQNIARSFIAGFGKLQRVAQNTHLSGIISSETELALDSINLIRDQLNFTFASIYLLEEEGFAQRILGGLNLQQVNIDKDVQLQLGNGVSEAIRTQAIVQIDSESSDVLRQYLLQGSQAALAVPIIEQGEIMGVLDVQSEDLKRFSARDVEIISLIASQLGLGLSHARLIKSLRSDLNEQNKLITRQRERLLGYERAERRATTSAWASYLQQRGIEYMGFDMKEQIIEPALKHEMDDDLEVGVKTGEISILQENGNQIVRVPIMLRGQTLGAMSFRVPQGSQIIGPRQQELIRSVVQRLALALENKRLFEQSQAQAQRESKANEVGGLLLSTTDIDTVLQLAADHFNEALGAIQTQIHLRPETPQFVEDEEIS